MRLAPFAVLLTILAFAGSASAQLHVVLISQRGARCLTARNNKLVAAVCAGGPDQTVDANFAIGGLQIQGHCFRRSAGEVTFDACRTGDPGEVFEFNAQSHEIATDREGMRVCLEVPPTDPRPAPRVVLAPCIAAPQQKWLLAGLSDAPGHGDDRSHSSPGDLKPGDYFHIGNHFLVVR